MLWIFLFVGARVKKLSLVATSEASGLRSEVILGLMVHLPYQIWQGLAPLHAFGEVMLSTI